MSIDTAKLRQHLEALNFFKLEENFDSFIAAGRRMAESAIRGQGAPRFALDRSFLKRDQQASSQIQSSLIIDVGGSKTKVALYSNNLWKILLYRDNASLRPIVSGPSALFDFVSSLTSAIVNELSFLAIDPGSIQSLGVIWSNALEAQPLDSSGGGPRGVTATICGIDGLDLGSYRKGEWFIRGLHNGSALGQVFIDGLKVQHISPAVFIIGNDTVFTLKALPHADAGMVASTGANATLIDPQGFICNAEIGGLYELGEEFLSSIDRGDLATTSTKLEDLIAGKWLPQLFERYVLKLGQLGNKECQRFAAIIENFRARNQLAFDDQGLSAILYERFPIAKIPLELFGEKSRSSAELLTLQYLAQQIVRRAGIAAAGMAYFSVCTLGAQKTFRISLDSSQARLLPGYMQAMSDKLSKLLAPASVELELLSPEEIESHGSTGIIRGQITVPMRGVTNALQEYF